jgi:hypothetical protein
MESFEVGDYLCSESDLFRVEQLAYGRAVVEDCRTGDLLDVPLSELLGLARIVRSRREPSSVVRGRPAAAR